MLLAQPQSAIKTATLGSYLILDAYQSSSTITDTINVTNHAPSAFNDNYTVATSTLTVNAASGVLANDTDPDSDTLSAALVSGPSHGTLTLNSDGSFIYVPNAGFLGTDSFVYSASDGIATSNATDTLTIKYSVLSATDETKVPVDVIAVSRQILTDPFNGAISSPLPAGGSGGTDVSAAPADGAPATAHNLSLAYNSVLGQPDQVIEADLGLSTNASTAETITATLTFNGSVQPAQYISMSALNGTTSHVLYSQQLDTSSLSSGRYPWSLTITSPHMQAPATVSGFVNVVNDSSSPFGKGWDMPGLYRLFSNSVSGVPSGVLLSTGDGGACYYTQGTGSSYTSPAGPLAFSTLTSLTGGGWQLVTHDGVTFTFNSSGYLSGREERTGETTSYTWSAGTLTTITDQFGRSVTLAYTSGLLSSITDFASHSWTVAHTGSNLTSVTEPNPGGGAPQWQYAYSGNYMTSATDADGNQTQFSLDGFHRLSGTIQPDSTTTGAVSEQDFGYGSTSSSSPANVTLATSVVPTMTDERGYTSSYQTDQFGDVTSETDAYGNITTTNRDSNGLPTQITLPPPTTGAASPVTNIYYDSTGDETYATGAQPTYGTYTYNSFAEWATFTDSLGNQWTRTFDTNGNLLTETDPSGNQVSWTYNSYGQPLTMVVPAPNNGSGTKTTHYYYDSDDRLDQILWPDSTSEYFTYNSDDFQVTFEDENSHTAKAAFDVLNRVTSVTNAASGVTSTTYDKDGNVLTTTDALGNVTSYTYDSMNDLTQETLPDPDGGGPLAAPVLSWTFDADGNVATSTDALSRQTTYTYDHLDRLSQETLPPLTTGGTSPTISFAYDNIGRQVTETDPLSGVTTTSYGNTDLDEVTSVEQPPPSGSGSGPTTSYGYDGDGRQNTVTDPMSHTTTTTFTIDGETASVADNLTNTTMYTYGKGGELLATTDPRAHATDEEYDSRYRLIQSTDANSGVTAYTLDGVGNVTSMTDPDGNTTSWTYDSLNRTTAETNTFGTSTTTYDADSNIISTEDADARVRAFTYDNLQRLTAEKWMSGLTVATMSYAFDAADELTAASDSNSDYAFTYDGDGDVTSTDNYGTPNVPHVVLASTYDAAGDRASLAATVAGTADFINSYTYDGDGNLTKAQQQQQSGGNTVAPKEVDYAYNALGQFTSLAYYNMLSGPRTDVATGTFSYDGDNRLSGLVYTSAGGTTSIDTYGWTYDAAGNVDTFTSNDGTATYGYDATNQLASASYTTASGGHQPANESYSFDANGNRDSTGYSTGSDNQMSSDGTWNYAYDNDGNEISRTQVAGTYSTDYKTVYIWDYRNRLTDVEDYDNSNALTQHVHYVYDAFDHLIATEVDPTGGGSYTQIEHYVADVAPDVGTAPPVLVFDGSGNLIGRNLVAINAAGVDAIIAEGTVSSLTSADAVNWDLTDDLGSLRIILDNGGGVIDEIVYSSFGQIAYESHPAISHFTGFDGGHVDSDTGLVNDYHRWYDPATGKWLSEDPIGFAAGDTNLSRFVGNAAATMIDPSGLDGQPSGPALTWLRDQYEQMQERMERRQARIQQRVQQAQERLQQAQSGFQAAMQRQFRQAQARIAALRASMSVAQESRVQQQVQIDRANAALASRRLTAEERVYLTTQIAAFQARQAAADLALAVSQANANLEDDRLHSAIAAVQAGKEFEAMLILRRQRLTEAEMEAWHEDLDFVLDSSHRPEGRPGR